MNKTPTLQERESQVSKKERQDPDYSTVDGPTEVTEFPIVQYETLCGGLQISKGLDDETAICFCKSKRSSLRAFFSSSFSCAGARWTRRKPSLAAENGRAAPGGLLRVPALHFRREECKIHDFEDHDAHSELTRRCNQVWVSGYNMRMSLGSKTRDARSINNRTEATRQSHLADFI